MLQPTPATALYQTPEQLLTALTELRRRVKEEGDELYARWRPYIEERSFTISALNLAQYLVFRERDLRPLQTALRPYGLSSLGRSESRVMPTLDAVIATLSVLVNREAAQPRPKLSAFFRGERMLRRHTDAVFGPMPEGSTRRTRIMVTFPSEAADDYGLVRDLVARGMNIARINCAHDDADAWQRMIQNIRRAQGELGKPVKVHMDLGGPKARTAVVLSPKKTPLHIGAHVLMTKGVPVKDDQFPFQIQCALPEVFDQLKLGHRVWIDDGEVGTEIEALVPEGAILRVIHTGEGGYKLKPEKGLNFPDTDLRLNPLTDDDIDALDFIAYQADSIGYSFVQEAEDIERLQHELSIRLEEPHKIAIIAKIETPRSIRNLPQMIVAAAGKQPFGVMIARGDLAVEIGFARLAEVQEQLLWLCEAAHVPVIWATQVLEKFVKKGMPSRSEMTDAAMAARAECVMLNKGAYVVDAVEILDDVLNRMQGHQMKKTPQLRALRAWASLMDGDT